MRHCQDCLWWLPNRPTFRDINPTQCTNLKIYIPVVAELGCDNHLAADSPEFNIPIHNTKGTMKDPNPNPVNGPVEILIVTHSKDFPWLEYCLLCMAKHCRGFQGVTVAVPIQDAPIAEKILARIMMPFRARVYAYNETPGMGMIQHMVMMAKADIFLPAQTKYVLTCDADCMFRMPTNPEHYFHNDKPYYIYRTWGSLTTEDPRNPASKVVSDCMQWKGPTDAQLGFDTEIFGMCMNTVVFPIEFFKLYRNHIDQVHGSFERYMMTGRNAFPQDRMDFTALGGYAWRYHRHLWHWFNVENPPYPEDRKKAYWSHGGITPDAREQIEGFLR